MLYFYLPYDPKTKKPSRGFFAACGRKPSTKAARFIRKPREIIERDVIIARKGDKMVHRQFLRTAFPPCILLARSMQQRTDLLLRFFRVFSHIADTLVHLHKNPLPKGAIFPRALCTTEIITCNIFVSLEMQHICCYNKSDAASLAAKGAFPHCHTTEKSTQTGAFLGTNMKINRNILRVRAVPRSVPRRPPRRAAYCAKAPQTSNRTAYPHAVSLP